MYYLNGIKFNFNPAKENKNDQKNPDLNYVVAYWHTDERTV